MARLRVLVVEDSLTVRKHVVATYAADPTLEVVGEAEDGRQAIELCLKHRPDVISMDMMLPVMTGLAATEYIIAHCPTPILVVSASVNRGELYKTYDALAAGAVDVFDKAGLGEADGAQERKLIAAIKMVAKIRVITHPRGRLMSLDRPVRSPPSPITSGPRANRRREVVAIGASTGGPAAIVEVLRGLPPSFSLPVLFVLHINEPFGAAFADWLDGQTPRRVAYAKDGDSIAAAAGRVVMAPAGRHLIVRDRKLRLIDTPERHSCRPSVDVLFESVAHDFGPGAAAALLTGMGRDGASGLREIHKAGGATIAQDEATSVIFGMPREAILLGAADRVLPLGEIGAELAAACEAVR